MKDVNNKTSPDQLNLIVHQANLELNILSGIMKIWKIQLDGKLCIFLD